MKCVCFQLKVCFLRNVLARSYGCVCLSWLLVIKAAVCRWMGQWKAKFHQMYGHRVRRGKSGGKFYKESLQWLVYLRCICHGTGVWRQMLEKGSGGGGVFFPSWSICCPLVESSCNRRSVHDGVSWTKTHVNSCPEAQSTQAEGFLKSEHSADAFIQSDLQIRI